jgi:hypothetical protein
LPVSSFLPRYAPVSSFVAAEADAPDVASAVWPPSPFLSLQPFDEQARQVGAVTVG